jgi:hypothetical protein
VRFLEYLYRLSEDASTAAGFQPRTSYVVLSVVLPVTIGLLVGFSLRLVERLFGIGRGVH